MTISKTGTRICEKCNKEFNWAIKKLKRHRISDSNSNLILEDVPSSNSEFVLARYIPFNSSKKYIGASCPKCDYDNHFYEDTEDTNESSDNDTL